MKKNLSTQSLLNSRRSSLLKIVLDTKQHCEKDKFIPKNQLHPSIPKSPFSETRHQEAHKVEHKKNDIKQIYEYKIKERAKRSKLQTQISQQISKQPSNQNQPLEEFKQMQSLKLQNQKMSKQLYDIAKENKRLKELLINAQKNKISAKNNPEPSNTQKDYKKQMLSKLNQRQRLKTQMTASFSKPQLNEAPTYQKKSKNSSKEKKNGSKSKPRESSRSSITMNLNMSFVKMKSPSSGKNGDFIKNPSKQMLSRMLRSNSSKQFLTFKQQSQSQQRSQLISPKNAHPPSIKQLFSQLLKKKQVNVKDLEEFYSLNKKIFAEFNELILFSKQTFTELLNKTNISECYDSKKMQESKHSMGQSMKMKTVLDKIHELYRANSLNGFEFRSQNEANEDSSGKKYNVSEIEPNELLTPESSVMSFTEMHNNPEREKSHEKYRVKKLNENLGLIANFENKKLKSEVTEAGTTEPKVYFSKPVSTNVSRKISFNNSFNNSLKNSKIE